MNQSRKVKSWQELANEYGVHINTIRNWVKPIYPQLRVARKKVLLAWQVEKIYQYLDEPNSFEFEDLE